jgi:hypothetical protein
MGRAAAWFMIGVAEVRYPRFFYLDHENAPSGPAWGGGSAVAASRRVGDPWGRRVAGVTGPGGLDGWVRAGCGRAGVRTRGLRTGGGKDARVADGWGKGARVADGVKAKSFAAG